jgi:hypothetical protein
VKALVSSTLLEHELMLLEPELEEALADSSDTPELVEAGTAH